jgi:formamidopyrimidine-DNA glycosylase
MFELPEMITLAKQMNETIMGRTIRRGVLGNTPHKFVWYNRTHEEFEQLTHAKKVGEAHVKDMKTTPVEADFTYPYFASLIEGLAQEGKKSAKGLLTQDQTIPGLGNAIAQDILFKAGLQPKHPVNDLNEEQKQQLYDQIRETVNEVISKGGRNDEHDLHNNPGNYVRLMDKNSVKNPCPQCGGKVEKIQYLGGACYVCPECQK